MLNLYVHKNINNFCQNLLFVDTIEFELQANEN